MNETTPLGDKAGQLGLRLMGLLTKWWLVVGLWSITLIVIHFNLFDLAPKCYRDQGSIRLVSPCTLLDDLLNSLLYTIGVWVGGVAVLFLTWIGVLFLAVQFDQHFEQVRSQALRDSDLWRRGFWLARAREVAIIGGCVAFLAFSIALEKLIHVGSLLDVVLLLICLAAAALALGIFWQFLMSLVAGMLYWKMRGRPIVQEGKF